MISRISSRKDIDGIVDGVDFDTDDKLALDGQRLLLKSGTYLQTNATYETETQSNLKIEQTGSGSTTTFIITSPDGSKSWYSAPVCATCSTLPVNAFFYIYKYEDVNGNQIIYEYIPGTILSSNITPTRIKRIKFSYNTFSNTVFQNTIEFTYKPRQRSEIAYFNGAEFKNLTLLDYVEVKTKTVSNTDLIFRKYQLSYTIDDLSYERLTTITESNVAGETANPLIFEYDGTSNGILKTNPNAISFADGIDMTTGIKFAGDFNGDSRLDVAFSNILYLKSPSQPSYTSIDLPFTASERTTITGSCLINNKLSQYQSIINANESATSIEFKIATLLPNSTSLGTTEKLILLNNQDFTHGVDTEEYLLHRGGQGLSTTCQTPLIKSTNQYLEGDFNGDGISEVLVYKSINEKFYFHTKKYYLFSAIPSNVIVSRCEVRFIDDGKECFIIDLNPNSSTVLGQVGNIQLTNTIYLQGDKKYVADYNGDGKSDVLVINNNGSYKIVGFKQLLVSPWLQLEVLATGYLDEYSTEKQIFFGDYNGDGKIDIMLPNSSGDGCQESPSCLWWYIYYNKITNNGSGFTSKIKHIVTAYMPKLEYPSGHTYRNQYFAVDVNKDGKTDVVRFEFDDFYSSGNEVWQEDWRVHTFINNIKGNTIEQTETIFVNDLVTNWYNGTRPGGSIPFFNTSRNSDKNIDFMVFSFKPFGNGCSIPNCFYKYCYYYSFTRNFNRDNSLKRVISSGGSIVDEVFYAPMISSEANSGQGTPTDFYSNSNTSYYPFLSIRNMPTQQLVFSLKYCCRWSNTL